MQRLKNQQKQEKEMEIPFEERATAVQWARNYM